MAQAKEGSGASASADRATRQSPSPAVSAAPAAGIPSAGHTPGPWEVKYLHDTHHYGCFQIVTFAQRQRAHMRERATGGDKAEREANARLIAAAPELLEALEKILLRTQPLDGDEPEDDRRDKRLAHSIARIALAKARGQ